MSPAHSISRRRTTGAYPIAAALLANVLVVSFSPLLWSWAPELGGAVYEAYSTLCHQIAARSFEWWGHPLPLCARCTGLWFGVFLVAASKRKQRLSVGVGTLLAALLVLDWLVAQAGASPDLAIERFLTGIAGGMGVGIITYRLWSLWKTCRLYGRLRAFRKLVVLRGQVFGSEP